MAAVELYTTTYCPYCVRAKALLDQKKVVYTEINVGVHPELREQMSKRANGGYSVPQIFINEQHIGGCDEMMQLEYKGQLDALLKH
jgi:glutaredoxin 3